MTVKSMTLAAATLVLTVGHSAQAADATSGADAVKQLDTDNDTTLDMAEVKNAAVARFQSLDVDHDGTLTKNEVSGKVSGTEFAKINTDKDGTLDQDEYLKIVQARFTTADTDHDGTLSAKELQTKAGKAVRSLLLITPPASKP